MPYHNNGLMVKHVKELISYWDYEKNNPLGLNPEEIPVNSCKIAFWRCPNGHFWKEKVSKMYRRKIKCFYCEGRMVWTGENDLKTLYPELAAEWDYEKNVITPDNVSPRDTNLYWWKCKNGHESFLRSVEHRVNRKDQCPYCSGRKVIKGVNDLETLFPEIAAEWDYKANEGVLPSEVSPNTWKSYTWICPKGHHYKMKVYLRTHSVKSVDCTKCVKSHSTSFPEQAVYYYAKQFYPIAINKWKGLSKTGLELDIFIPEYNIGIEYDGKAYHSSKEQIQRDNFKYKICRERGIKLIRIKEGDAPNFSFENANEVYYIKKRPNDMEMNYFLSFFFEQITMWSRNTYQLPFDIDIKRDRPKILEYLVDIENSFGKLYPGLAKNWDYDKNGKLTPYMLSPGSNHIAFFKCEKCGNSWSAPICIVTKWNRSLCKKCSMKDNGIRQTKKFALIQGSLGEKFPEAIKQWDKKANKNLTPFDIPSGYSGEIFWECPDCGYKWSQSPWSRTCRNKLSKCPHCSGRVAIPGVDDLETLHPEIAKEWDYSKNIGITPSEIKPNSTIKRYWICSKHHKSFKTSSACRIKGVGCIDCKGEKIKAKAGFRVEQYNKKLEYIRTFSSLNEAGELLNTSPEAIRQAVLNGTISNNSYFKYEGTQFGMLKPDRKHQIVAINIKTGLKTEYESSRDAERQTGIGHSSIMKCCKKVPKYKTAGGYYWYFKDEEPST